MSNKTLREYLADLPSSEFPELQKIMNELNKERIDATNALVAGTMAGIIEELQADKIQFLSAANKMLSTHVAACRMLGMDEKMMTKTMDLFALLANALYPDEDELTEIRNS